MPLRNKTEDREKYFNNLENEIEWETTLDITKGGMPMK